VTNGIQLTDEQYQRVLRKIETTIAQDDFKVSCFDSTFPGDKYTESNCGFCNDEYTDRDMALFPKQFPERKSMKYRQKNHKCPFDERNAPNVIGWGCGCFGKCYLFGHLGEQNWNLSSMREMVKRAIGE